MATEPTDEAHRPPPQLPHGSPSTLNGLSETFSFHSSPETFIASRVLAFQAERGNLVDPVPPVHAKILNRNVAVISSHSQITHILSTGDRESEDAADPTFVATKAYEPFMAAFFPTPNLLLSDGAEHARMRTPWERRMQQLGPKQMRGYVRDAAHRHFLKLVNSEVDLYESLKFLLWKILLGLMLQLDESDPDFHEIVRLHEDLLRGQFSLFPVSVNVRIWQSPRSKGVAAKNKLQRLILQRLKTVKGACPFHSQLQAGAGDELEQVTNHVLLFTSSLAVKAIASLLTAFLLNLFLLDRAGVRPAEEVRALQGEERKRLLRSIQLETERMSPPIVGIMRSVTRDTVIPSPFQDSPDVLLPKGWDAWLYFVGGGRDRRSFGETARIFLPDRFLDPGQPTNATGLAFSAGTKRCLGQGLVQEICLGIAETMLGDGLKLEGKIEARGVRAWLGWEDSEDVRPQEWAGDMKQLPTQRPAKPVKVMVSR